MSMIFFYYKRITIAIASIFSVILFSTCSSLKMRCLKDGYIQHDTTYFPAAQLDYKPSDHQVRLAVSENPNERKVWVKGSSTNRYVQPFDVNDNPLDEPYELSPPFFTAVFKLSGRSRDSVQVKFANAEALLAESNTKNWVNIAKSKNSTDNLFSFLVYGCFQPFYTDSDGKPHLVHDSSNPLNYEMRKLFEDVALEKDLQVLSPDSTSVNSTLLKNPLFVIGTGDQLYVDPGYEQKDFKNHAMSGWAHSCSDPYPLLNQTNYTQHLNRCYENFFSFECFDKVFSHLPSLNVWDDHEIRDGWGSHGDEYNNDGKLLPELKPYYHAAKKAFIMHQLMLTSEKEADSLVKENISLEQQLEVNGIPVFAFDLRSHRNIRQNRVIDEQQMNSFTKWSQSLENGKEVIIISSMPLFYKPNKPVNLLGRILKPELRDDINDGWYSKYNRGQRNEVIQEIIAMRERGIKPIILSGDAHLGAMISVWYNKKDSIRERLCYEFIFSGLSHESMGEERTGYEIRLRRRSDGRMVDDPTFPVGEYLVDYIYEYTEGRLNFGGIQFEKGKNTTVSLFMVGSEENYITKREMPLQWDQNYQEYLSQATKVDTSTYKPPELTLKRIFRRSEMQ